MTTNEALKLMEDKDFLDKIYQFSYRRCDTSFEAEELCSDILLTVVASVQKQDSIEHFYAFVWTVARRVYADFCRKRHKQSQNVSLENAELDLADTENEIEDLIEDTFQTEQLKSILNEIAFLSKAYRDVMVMYYIDEFKIKDIAAILHISEAAIKQRLFSARNTVKKEVTTMNQRNLSLKPIRLIMWGTGDPSGNDPTEQAQRTLSQNLIYLCKDKPKSARELSDELCVPMLYIEEELDIQCRGANGSYGTLRRLDNGKYITNILIVDYDEYDKANKIYEQYLPEFCSKLKANLDENREKIISFPYLSPQTDIRFILWSMINTIVWKFKQNIDHIISNQYFSDITPNKRPFSLAAIAVNEKTNTSFGFYGSDGFDACDVGGYRSIFVSNIYGQRIDKHFDCFHNLSHDEKLLMVLQAIGGLSVDTLTETDKEIAAKAVAYGYLRKTGSRLEPNLIVIDKKNKNAFYDLIFQLNQGMRPLTEKIAEESATFIKKHLPKHLKNEYQTYTQLIAGIRILHKVIEAYIQEGILTKPNGLSSGEGILMIVEK